MAALITLAAAGNSLLRGVQALAYGRRVRRIVVPEDPIFIIGHWRTGTTMLHELLALDPRHRCPSTYESLAPNHFLLSERFVRRFARFLLPRTRPFDNMRMSFDRPQEDEAALALRGIPSPFLTVAFPRRPPQHPEYVDLERLSPRQLAAWQSGMRRFLQLLLFRRPGRLVLKSPQHTNRLRVLNRDVSPGAIHLRGARSVRRLCIDRAFLENDVRALRTAASGPCRARRAGVRGL